MVKTKHDNKRGELAHVRTYIAVTSSYDGFVLDFNHFHLRLALESGVFLSGLLADILCFEKVTYNADLPLNMLNWSHYVKT